MPTVTKSLLTVDLTVASALFLLDKEQWSFKNTFKKFGFYSLLIIILEKINLKISAT